MTPAHRTALLWIGVLTLLRCAYAPGLGLAWDEAYYWQWSRHLDLSYYDQGPGIAYVIRLGTLLFGNTHFGIRFPTILMAAGAGYLTFLTARQWFGDRVALWSLALMSGAPLYAAGSLIATYDGPQVFFWAAALHALTKLLHQDRPVLWYAVGALVALGVLSKLTMLLFVPGVLLLLVLVPEWRCWLRSPHPYLAFVLVALAFTPIVLWNLRHDGLFFKHSATLSRRHTGAPFGRWLGDFLAGQALFIGPVAWLAELWALARVRKRTVLPRNQAFLVAFTLPALAVCLWTALRSKLEINWPAPMHLVGLMAVALLFIRLWDSGKALGRSVVVLSWAVNVGMMVLAFFPGLPGRLGATLPTKTFIKLSETYGWDQLATSATQARQALQTDGAPVFIAGGNYRIASALAFYLPDQPETYGLYFQARRDQYFIWTDPKLLVGQNTLFAVDEPLTDEALSLARRYFRSVEPLPPMAVTRTGYDAPVKRWVFYACRDFKGYNPEAHTNGY